MTKTSRRPGIEIGDKVMLVTPPTYPSEEVKEQCGGRWDKDEKVWKVQPTAMNVLLLGDLYGPDFIGNAPTAIQDLFHHDWGFPGFEDNGNLNLKIRAEAHPRWNDLYPFQHIAVEYIVCNPHRGTLLGLSPGLGKTPVSIVASDILLVDGGRIVEKILILAPLTLAKNWGKEIEKWSKNYRSWSRATAAEKDPKCEVTITNFETVFYTVVRDENGKVFQPEDMLKDGDHVYGQVKNPRATKQWINDGPDHIDSKTGKKVKTRQRITQARPSYADVDWDLLILDESIMLKNRKAVKVEVIEQLAKYSHYVLELSGSATAKYSDDLYAQMKILMPRGFSSYWRFAETFCVVERGQWGWSIEGDRPNMDPKKYLKDFYLVMNQKDVLPDLPDYIYDPIEIDLRADQQKAFGQMVEDWIVALEAEEGEEVPEGEEDVVATYRLAQQTRMLQITSNLVNLEKGAGKAMPNSSAKEDLLVDLIRQGDIEFPLLVWTWFQKTTESIDARLEKEFKDLRVTYVHGSLTADQKDAGIEAYKAGDVDVLVLQMSVGKFGHTLTDTKTVYYHDRSFESDAYIQSLRRVKRIGLTHRPRLIIPRAQFSADPIVELNLAGKMTSIAKVAAHDLRELLQSLGNIEWSMNTPGDLEE
jgi:SNF2 family DNA or RNA helicase